MLGVREYVGPIGPDDPSFGVPRAGSRMLGGTPGQ